MNKDLHVLHSDTRMRPLSPQDNEFYEKDQVAYVVRQTEGGGIKIITSFGHLGAGYEVGNIVRLIADQTGRRMGDHRVIGIIDFSTGIRYRSPYLESWKSVNKKLRHYVVK